MHTPSHTNVCNFFSFTYIFSADITPEMLNLGRVTKVKVFSLVLVYVFNINLFEFFREGSIGTKIVKKNRSIREYFQ